MKLPKIFGMHITRLEIVGILIVIPLIILDFVFFSGTDLFYFLLGIAFVIGGFPFFLSLILESNSMQEKNRMFLEFSRNLVESVQAGTPISRSIINVQVKDYGVLNPHIGKLANQISLGIPVKTALQTFARDIGSNTITKAINIISESEKAGGEIESILESVVESVSQIEKLRKERRNAMYGLVVQGYIIFMIFIVIMLVMEFKILPIATGLSAEVPSGGDISGLAGAGINIVSGTRASAQELARPFLWLLIVQGFFAGLVIGKLSEGEVKSGLKHSFILMVLSILINTGVKVYFSYGAAV